MLNDDLANKMPVETFYVALIKPMWHRDQAYGLGSRVNGGLVAQESRWGAAETGVRG